MYDISQPLDLTEAALVQRDIRAIRAWAQDLMTRAQELHLDDAAEHLDDALTYLSDADDAMQRALDDPMGRAA